MSRTVRLAVVMLTVLGSFAILAPAHAQVPPSCVQAFEDEGFFTDTVTVTNGCDSFQRVKVLVAFGFDSECMVLAPNESDDHSYDSIGRFDGLERC